MTGLAPMAPRAPERGAAAPDRERAMASGRLILVAEDHPVNQELIRHQLALLGFACDVVDDGVEALAALERTKYGCLITDCHMPNVSGYELTRRIRQAEAEPARSGVHRLPILGITANTAPDDLVLCHEAGMDDTLIKPTRLATLSDYLSRWFGTESASSQAALAEMPNVGSPRLAIEGPALRQPDAKSFVPVDLGHMAQLWGSESTVKALLDSFVSSMRDDLQSLALLLEHEETARMLEWQHRVAGAANVLQYPPLIHVLEDYRQQIVASAPERLRDEGLALIRKCAAMLDGIEQQAALLA
jgi:CheY-like chemotaxis protein